MPDPASCCPDAYYCTCVKATVCPRHYKGTPCGSSAHEHIPMDTEAWHRAHDHIEEALLDSVFRYTQDAGAARTLGGVLDDVLGVVPPSTLDAVHDGTRR